MARITRLILLALAVAHPAVAQTTEEFYPASAGRIYAASTSQMWSDVLRLLADNGLKIELKDDNGRFLVTQQVRVEAKRFGFAASAAVPNASTAHVKLHIFVPRFVEPARVYVGSTVTAEMSGGGRMLLYSPGDFGHWLLEKLAAKLSLPGHRIPQSPAARARLAQSLLGAASDKCLARIENGEGEVKSGTNWIAPRKLHGVPVVYPKSGPGNGGERTLTVHAVIGEDGFPWPIGVADGPPADDFAITSLGSVPLWRFTPLIVEGCPAPMPRASIGVRFERR